MARDLPGTSGNYLTVGDASAIDITGTALTVAMFVKYDADSGFARMVCKGTGFNHTSTPTGIQYGFYVDQFGFSRFAVGSATGNDNAALDDISAVLSQWRQYVATYDGSNLRVYVNGTEVAAPAATRSIQNLASSLYFGRDDANTDFFDGKLAEIGVWNVALSAGEALALGKGVSPRLIRPLSLKGYWPLWGAHSPEIDLSDNGNDATITGSVSAADHAPVGRLVPAAA